ncbi:MAG TPA: lytic transglycosylase domain-containing protein [Xanthobacteraceae bacterium]|nr:lytic transglycosylase domain-containing protein [Xanthobacteraceae bacterium]
MLAAWLTEGGAPRLARADASAARPALAPLPTSSPSPEADETSKALAVHARFSEDFMARTQAGRARWAEAVARAAKAYGIPEAFLARLLDQESGFDPTSVSRAGALGIAQFMPGTAVRVGLRDPFDPAEAIPAAAAHLRMLLARFGNLGLAAAAYNAGAQRVADWLAGRSALPDETVHYVRAVTGRPVTEWAPARAALDVPSAPAQSARRRGSRGREPYSAAAALCQALGGAAGGCIVQPRY